MAGMSAAATARAFAPHHGDACGGRTLPRDYHEFCLQGILLLPLQSSAYAGNKLNSCFRQTFLISAADTAANKQIDAVFLKEPSEGGMSAFFRIDSFLISYFAALDIKD